MAERAKNDWRKGMRSPNPKGRPKGITDRRALATKKLFDATSEVADQVITAAKAGDLNAAALLFSRVLPALKPQGERIQFELDTSAPLTKQVEQVLAAMADGKLSPDVTRQIVEAIAALGTVRQLEEFDTRLSRLESVN